MKKIGIVVISAIALLMACHKTESDTPQPATPQIEIPSESQAVFSRGMSLEAGTSAQSQTVKFTATADWSASATDTKASSWLTVKPEKGNAGTITLTVTAQPNPGTADREASVTIRCGSASQKFTVKQAGLPQVSSVTLNETELALVEGDTFTLTASVLPDNAADKTVTWSSSDTQVATVVDGKVTAVKDGTATITAQAGEIKATCQVTVSKKFIAVESVTLDKETLELTEGDEALLTATVLPENATDKTLTWNTSDAEVATVEDGKVTAVKEGVATITAQAGEIKATCQVTVSKKFIAVESVTLDKETLELTEGDVTLLTATVLPENATDKTLAWNTSNAQVATVKDGKVTAVKEGVATITAQAGEIKATCQVTVSKKFIAVESVTLDKETLELTEGDEALLAATVLPENATDKTLTWNTSDAGVAAVEDGKVTALKEGTATITAQAGEIKATCLVTVSKKFIAVESVTLDKETLELTEGDEALLTTTVLPENATDKTLTWNTSDAEVAAVEEGKVTALKEGTATITAQAGEIKATCQVTVSKKTIAVESVILDKTSLNLMEGDEVLLTATVKPDDATDKSVTWSSSDENVATVSDGKVKAVKGGNAVISARAGDCSASCEVTVEAIIPVESIRLNKEELSLEKGGSESLTATVLPEKATFPELNWESDNQAVAEVSQSGLVTAKGGGEAYITVSSTNGLQARCHVVVTVSANGISLNKTETTLVINSEETLVATVSPADATDKTVSWSSSDGNVVQVDDNGKLTARSVGNATITAKTYNDFAATCLVTVVIPDTEVTLSETEITLNKGERHTLTARIQPEDATWKTLTWSSDKTAVATVNADGVVTAVGCGQATIMVMTPFRNTARCVVTVEAPVEGVVLNETTHTLVIGDSFDLTVSFTPADATLYKELTWSITEGSSFVSIQNNGTSCRVTGLATGSATVKVKSANGKEAVCTFTVVEEDKDNTEGYENGEGEWDD